LVLPWDKDFLSSEIELSPKTILYASEGQNVNSVSRTIVKKVLGNIDSKDYLNLPLEEIASQNFIFLHPKDKSVIDIDQIRDSFKYLFLKSNSKRLLYLENIERVETRTFNTLLKFSEEADKNIIIYMATNNINIVPKTILSRFQKLKIPKPSNENVNEHLTNLGLNFDEQKNDFVLQNLNLLSEHEDKDINELFLKFDEYEAKKQIPTKDKEEIRLFLDYQIHKIKFNMLKLNTNKKGKLDEFRDLRKQILMPHNLSLDILKSKLCLYI
jgi:replication-associated recombination protein RarA